MILYLGTSSLAKLYADEPDSARMRELVGAADYLATCRVAYTELLSAIDGKLARHEVTRADHQAMVDAFNRDWEYYVAADFDEKEAGRMMQVHGLRRFDAIHLSAAKLIRKELNGVPLFFSSADESLNRAAAAEGMTVVTAVGPSGRS